MITNCGRFRPTLPGTTSGIRCPPFLIDTLAEQVAGKASDDLVFTTVRGAVLRNLNFRRDVFGRAAIVAGLDGLTPHELATRPCR